MAENLLRNATFLDGVSDWTRNPTNALTSFGVDESVRGAEGRGVLVASGVTVTAGLAHNLNVATDALPAVSPGELAEASTWWWSNSPNASARLLFRDEANTIIQTNILPNLRPLGAGSRGLPETFAFARGRFAAPANTAKADLRLAFTSTDVGLARTLALFRPFLGKAAAADPVPSWAPGSHANPDLNLRVWPLACGMILDSWPTVPTPTHVSFASDSGVPLPHRVAAAPRWEVRPAYQLNRAQLDQLLSFHAATEADGDRSFWFLEPGMSRLCRAFWLDDGAPAVVEHVRAGLMRVQVGLLLEVA